jgi:hypothetical protein
MKYLLTILLFFFSIQHLGAQDKYEQAMKQNMKKMDDGKTASDFVKIANGFERISHVEKDKWLPLYYTSLNYIYASYADTINTNKDMYLDKAVEFISRADSIDPLNSEIYTIKGMISQSRMQVDPMNRWQKFGQDADKNFKKAMEIDTLNPRPEYLIGIGVYYTPAQFGGGAENARPLLENSLRKFKVFIPANELMPNWGKEYLEEILKPVKKE